MSDISSNARTILLDSMSTNYSSELHSSPSQSQSSQVKDFPDSSKIINPTSTPQINDQNQNQKQNRQSPSPLPFLDPNPNLIARNDWPRLLAAYHIALSKAQPRHQMFMGLGPGIEQPTIDSIISILSHPSRIQSYLSELGMTRRPGEGMAVRLIMSREKVKIDWDRIRYYIRMRSVIQFVDDTVDQSNSSISSTPNVSTDKLVDGTQDEGEEKEAGGNMVEDFERKNLEENKQGKVIVKEIIRQVSVPNPLKTFIQSLRELEPELTNTINKIRPHFPALDESVVPCVVATIVNGIGRSRVNKLIAREGRGTVLRHVATFVKQQKAMLIKMSEGLLEVVLEVRAVLSVLDDDSEVIQDGEQPEGMEEKEKEVNVDGSTENDEGEEGIGKDEEVKQHLELSIWQIKVRVVMPMQKR
ncbi:hypothetical protein TREMEDRAFT_61819 [Tremella mesenterica DSM 1558]|uniref:uncharacterized protein n=1 Tax=Tremella mesenterica (strain ATCC 24925 / CBS 8224 / DSM 1558 / NBRC 9311 / NRRL Y-6157 / RJB 2259-6 / UBC 559-6) TaxID=578456 RepID=UPI0003F49FA3|nr:uncharacterized protein TREMEDRAFT_61819 [Tremella mesenterica DSM 1558]EIW70056.1 hypothetical protein TREMEDRAFT_61819 [Tremella mesenterica DSM 1558]